MVVAVWFIFVIAPPCCVDSVLFILLFLNVVPVTARVVFSSSTSTAPTLVVLESNIESLIVKSPPLFTAVYKLLPFENIVPSMLTSESESRLIKMLVWPLPREFVNLEELMFTVVVPA